MTAEASTCRNRSSSGGGECLVPTMVARAVGSRAVGSGAVGSGIRTGAVPEEVPVPLRRAGRRARGGSEPGVLVRRVVRHHVDDHPESERGAVGTKASAIVPNIGWMPVKSLTSYPSVGHRRRVPRRHPHPVDARIGQTRQPPGASRRCHHRRPRCRRRSCADRSGTSPPDATSRDHDSRPSRRTAGSWTARSAPKAPSSGPPGPSGPASWATGFNQTARRPRAPSSASFTA